MRLYRDKDIGEKGRGRRENKDKLNNSGTYTNCISFYYCHFSKKTTYMTYFPFTTHYYFNEKQL